MKRMTAFVMALAMMLTLTACGGGNADQPSNSTPPATQNEPSTQPDSNPANSSQPSEPDNTPTNEPQNNVGALPDGGFYLYDGVHYLSVVGDSDIISTVISGEKIANTTHEISVEQAESNTGRVCGSMSVTLGQNEEPFNYQISFVDDYYTEFNGTGKTVAPGKADTFSVADAFAWVVNPTGEEKIVADCPVFLFTIDRISEGDTQREKALDGKSIAKLGDLINVLGTPTAAYCMNGEFIVYYIWQFEDFIYTAQVGYDFEEIYDEERQIVYFDVNWDTGVVTALFYYAPNYEIDETSLTVGLDPAATAWPVQALTDLGLL